MRFDTHRISEYLVIELMKARPQLQVTDDGGDIIQVKMASGETVRIYLIESEMALYELTGILDRNDQAGVHTLFILWCDILLPGPGVTGSGQRFKPHDVTAALIALYGGKIYAYDPFAPELLVFPVHFDRQGADYVTRYGKTVEAARLYCSRVHAQTYEIHGHWRVASFDAPVPSAEEIAEGYFEVLGLKFGADLIAVKRAYRRLARKLHPDVNQSPEATAQMQRLNEAYERILADLDNGESQ
jgi:DnaJ-like protein